MAYTSYADVPGAHIGGMDLVFRVKADGTLTTRCESIEEFQAVAFHTTAGQVTKTTTANSAIAGFSQEGFTNTDFPEYHIAQINVRVAGTTHYIAGADCSTGIGASLVVEGTDGRMTVCAGVANTHYVTQGWGLDNPDADGNIGTMLIMLNQPYFVSAS